MTQKLQEVLKKAKEVCEELSAMVGTTAALAPYPVTPVDKSSMVKVDGTKKKPNSKHISKDIKSSTKSNS